jgi:hypothetical protein
MTEDHVKSSKMVDTGSGFTVQSSPNIRNFGRKTATILLFYFGHVRVHDNITWVI